MTCCKTHLHHRSYCNFMGIHTVHLGACRASTDFTITMPQAGLGLGWTSPCTSTAPSEWISELTPSASIWATGGTTTAGE